jgi:phenylacetate-coenzyme A ligase PaaK-like adenylate-forming protein
VAFVMGLANPPRPAVLDAKVHGVRFDCAGLRAPALRRRNRAAPAAAGGAAPPGADRSLALQSPQTMLPPFDPWLSASIAVDVMEAGRVSPQALAQRQAQRLAALLRAAASSKLYAPWLAGRDLSRMSLQSLPVVHKSELMARFSDWVTGPSLRLDDLRRFMHDPSRIGEPFAQRYTVWESSGSTGEPAVFVQDAMAMAVYDALEALRRPPLQPRRWMDPYFLGERIAFVGATTGHFASTVSIERLRRLNPLMAASLHGVSFLQPCRRIVQALDALRPTIVATYPSAALMLAEEALAGRLKTRPREIWCGGETLTPAVRLHVQQAFGCRIANSYGASEFLALASECAHGRLHLNADWALLEPQGETALLTNLANHVQPLIRYDLGDRVRFAEQACPCGSALPVIEVQGRCDDVLTVGSRAHRVRLLPLALCTVLEDEAGLYDFQLQQCGPDQLRLCGRGEGRAGQERLARGQAALRAFLARQGVARVRIECCCGDAGVQGRSGKLQRVVSLLP